MAKTIEHVYKFKRATAERWDELNPILLQGEPGFAYDQNKLKIGDGFTPWKGLPYIGEGEVTGIVNIDTAAHLPAVGDSSVIYKVLEEARLYQWNNGAYELLASGEVNLEEVYAFVEDNAELKQYKVFSCPAGTRVHITDYEIRIMCPASTIWAFQNNGADKDTYYLGLKIYAPSIAEAFKEDLDKEIADNTLYYFVNNDFAGIDANGRKYSIIWLPAAKYNQETSSWVYHGVNSSEKKFIGWYYTVEWYDATGSIIESKTIRINLSNEQCHNHYEPYYMGSIDISKLTQAEGTVLELYGGSAIDNIGGTKK